MDRRQLDADIERSFSNYPVVWVAAPRGPAALRQAIELAGHTLVDASGDRRLHPPALFGPTVFVSQDPGETPPFAAGVDGAAAVRFEVEHAAYRVRPAGDDAPAMTRAFPHAELGGAIAHAAFEARRIARDRVAAASADAAAGSALDVSVVVCTFRRQGRLHDVLRSLAASAIPRGGYPWGCNWSARRSLLLGIGGFRASYGRSGNDFNGAEELIAAACIRALGYHVGVEPRAVVHHRPDVDRYSLSHIRRTIVTGILRDDRATRDGYLEPRSVAPARWRQLRKLARGLVSPHERLGILLQAMFIAEGHARLVLGRVRAGRRPV
jgi:hypothetical protein